MMNPNWQESMSGMKVFVDGKEIGEMKSMKAEIEPISVGIMGGYNPISGTLLVESLKASMIPAELLEPSFDIVASRYDYPRKPLPKKKRIRKKWRKKYLVGKVTYKNCVVTGYGESVDRFSRP